MLLTLAGDAQREAAKYAFFLSDPSQVMDSDRFFTLTEADFRLLNPNTGVCPTFRSRRDAELTLAIYRTVPALKRDGMADGNPWIISTKPGLFHMGNDAALFVPVDEAQQESTLSPLYEAKMVHQFDCRWSSYSRGSSTR